MADSSLKAPLSSNQEQIRRELLPREWSAALVLDYLSKSEYGGELTQRTLAIGNATYNLQVTVEGLALDLAALEVDTEAHISANSAHGATGSIVGRLDYCSTTAGGVVLQADSVDNAASSEVNIVTANVGAAGAAYAQAYAQQQTDLINELKAAVNQLASDLNAAITTLNNSLSTERTAKQRAMIEPKHEHSLRVSLTEIFKGNQDAVDLCVNLFGIAQVWDDLVDLTPIEEKTINQAFLAALVILPTNRVFQSMPELPYHIYNVFLRWRDATAIERMPHTKDDLHKCYMLRAGLYDIFAIIAAKLYGDDYAAHIGPSIRRFYGESFDEYAKEFQ